jgi:hypothetical protein
MKNARTVTGVLLLALTVAGPFGVQPPTLQLVLELQAQLLGRR